VVTLAAINKLAAKCQ